MNTIRLSIHLFYGFISYMLLLILSIFFEEKTAILFALVSGVLILSYRFFKDNRLDIPALISLVLIIVYTFLFIIISPDFFAHWKSVFKATIPIFLCSTLLASQNSLSKILPQYKLKQMHITNLEEERFFDFFRDVFLVVVLLLISLIYAKIAATNQIVTFIEREFSILLITVLLVVHGIRYAFFIRNNKKGEWLPIVDANGGVKGQVLRSHCHGKQKTLHPVVHLHLIKNQSVYLQKRAMNKQIQPGMWDTAVGGHVDFGESIEEALHREAFEELGLRKFEPRFLLKYIWETDIEKELAYTFYASDFSEIKTNDEEIDDGKFWPISQIRDNLGKGVFTPNFEKEFEFLAQILFK